jgi:hypothetical protein
VSGTRCLPVIMGGVGFVMCRGGRSVSGTRCLPVIMGGVGFVMWRPRSCWSTRPGIRAGLLRMIDFGG